jgi:hypothetical protein
MGKTVIAPPGGMAEIVGIDGRRYLVEPGEAVELDVATALRLCAGGRFVLASEAAQDRLLALRAPPCATEDRPEAPPAGFHVFDTDLGKPIWWDGEGWVDAAGEDPDA